MQLSFGYLVIATGASGGKLKMVHGCYFLTVMPEVVGVFTETLPLPRVIPPLPFKPYIPAIAIYPLFLLISNSLEISSAETLSLWLLRRLTIALNAEECQW